MAEEDHKIVKKSWFVVHVSNLLLCLFLLLFDSINIYDYERHTDMLTFTLLMQCGMAIAIVQHYVGRSRHINVVFSAGTKVVYYNSNIRFHNLQIIRT